MDSVAWARDWAEREADAMTAHARTWPRQVRPDAAIRAGATLGEMQTAWDAIREAYVLAEEEAFEDL